VIVHPRIAKALLAAAIVCASAITVHAQSDAGAHDAVHPAFTYLKLDSSGGISLLVSLDPASPVAQKLVNGFDKATGCNLNSSVLREEVDDEPCYGATHLVWPWVRELDLDLAPISKQARASGMAGFWMGVDIPKSGFETCTPCLLAPTQPPRAFPYLIYVDTEKSEPARLRVTYGYRWRDLGVVFGPLATIPILLIALTLWMRRYSLRTASADPELAWFSYARFMKVGTQVAWLVWLGLLSLPALVRWVEFVAEREGQVGAIEQQAFVWAVIGLVPMAATVIVCRVLSSRGCMDRSGHGAKSSGRRCGRRRPLSCRSFVSSRHFESSTRNPGERSFFCSCLATPRSFSESERLPPRRGERPSR
jgi:hypothetical protein